MTAMPQSSLTPQPSRVPRASLERMKITLEALRVTIPGLNLGADAGMQMLAEEITPLTGSVGTAIALKTNNEIVCRASVGQAPAVGAVLQSGHGLSGECVLTGRLVRCDDTDVDNRVNPQVCRELGFRSVLIVPITLEDKAIGLVELLAVDAHHFTEDDVLFLNEVAAIVLELNGINLPGTQAEAVSPDGDLLSNFDVKDLMSALEQEMEEESAPAIMPEINDAVLMERLAFIRNDGVVPAVKTDIPAPVHPKPAARPRKQEAAGSKNLRWILVAALVTVVAIGAWLWRVRRLPDVSGKSQVLPAVSSPASTPVKSTDTASSVANPAVSSEGGLISVTPASEKLPPTAAGGQGKRRTQTLSPKRGSAELPAALSGGSGRDVTPDPSIAGLSTAAVNAPELPPVAQPASPVFQPTKVSSGLRGGAPIYQPRPAYPDMAKRNGVAGDVVLKFLVRKDGTVTNVRVVSGNPTLAVAAVQSVKLWRYRPFLLNGEPTETESQATIKFTSPR
jgi:TonB family protein